MVLVLMFEGSLCLLVHHRCGGSIVNVVVVDVQPIDVVMCPISCVCLGRSKLFALFRLGLHVMYCRSLTDSESLLILLLIHLSKPMLSMLIRLHRMLLAHLLHRFAGQLLPEHALHNILLTRHPVADRDQQSARDIACDGAAENDGGQSERATLVRDPPRCGAESDLET